MSQNPTKPEVVPKQYLAAFVLTTCCFALWGFANDVTNPLVKIFKEVFLVDNTKSSLVQFAFYGGYFTMALPAAIFIRKYSYKAAIMIGFVLYAVGAFLSIPASISLNFYIFILGLYILTFGLAFLETACNPYILAMGPPETATQRLNLAQAFNPMGAIVGSAVMAKLIAPALLVGEFRAGIENHEPEKIAYLIQDQNELPEGAAFVDDHKDQVRLKDGNLVAFYQNGIPDYKNVFGKLDGSVVDGLTAMRANAPDEFTKIQKADMGFVKKPYVTVGIVVVGFLLLFAFTKMPAFKEEEADAPFGAICRRIFSKAHFREGVLAQAFYVGAQITIFTFVIHYGMEVAQLTLGEATMWAIGGTVTFLIARFICTFLMRTISPGALMCFFALLAIAFLLGAIFLDQLVGLSCIIGVYACMSLMFPTIYGIALRGMPSEEAKLGSAFLIMAIVGGAILPLVQGKFIDELGIKNSFWLPVICFIAIAIYGFRSYRKFEHDPA